MNHNQARILWARVWSIAAIQGAITLGWVIYNLYFSQMLVELGFSLQLATILLIIENGIEAITEPIFGAISDRQEQKKGTKIPLIFLGIVISSILFILFPVVAVFTNSHSPFRWFFPILAVLWAGAMAIFRSPAISLLGRCAPTDKLPQAVSLLNLVAGLIGAFRFDVYGVILKLGPVFAFAIGSFILLLAAVVLRFFYLPSPVIAKKDVLKPPPLPTVGLILTTGISIGFGFRFLFAALGNRFNLQLGNSNGKLAMMLFFITLGLLAIPAGKVAEKLGAYKAIILGLLLTILSLLSLSFPSVFNVSPILLVVSFSLLLAAIIPFILTRVNQSHSGLGMGIYFGGFTGALSMFDYLFVYLGKITINLGIIGGCLAFLSALLFVIFTRRVKS